MEEVYLARLDPSAAITLSHLVQSVRPLCLSRLLLAMEQILLRKREIIEASAVSLRNLTSDILAIHFDM